MKKIVIAALFLISSTFLYSMDSSTEDTESDSPEVYVLPPFSYVPKEEDPELIKEFSKPVSWPLDHFNDLKLSDDFSSDEGDNGLLPQEYGENSCNHTTTRVSRAELDAFLKRARGASNSNTIENLNANFSIVILFNDLGKINRIELEVNRAMTVCRLLLEIQMKLLKSSLKLVDLADDIEVWLPPVGARLNKDDKRTLGECRIDRANLILHAAKTLKKRY